MSLLDLRSDLLQLIDDEPVLAALDEELQMYLSTVLGVEMLTVERISWDSPGSLLERVMQHEAVHAIRSWPDLKIRLSSGRRCYALFHVSMVGEPLVLVQLALTSGIVKSLPKLLSNTEDDIRPTRCDTAVFYSISTCHAGLVGMNLARWLIKRAIEELTMDEPDIHRFVTLSPIKGFRRWAEEELGVDELTKRGGSLLPTRENIRPAGGGSFKQDESSHAELLALCARYITTCNDGRSLDPVANFHLANGALLGSVNWRADPSTTGLEQSLGMMASYVYELDRVAERAEAYRTRGVIAVSQELRELLGLPPLRHQETPAERDAGGHYEL